MEIFALLEMLVGLLELLDLVGVVVEVVAWLRSKPNRAERRDARRRGDAPPPRTGWTWTFVLLGVALLLGNALLVGYLLLRDV